MVKGLIVFLVLWAMCFTVYSMFQSLTPVGRAVLWHRVLISAGISGVVFAILAAIVNLF